MGQMSRPAWGGDALGKQGRWRGWFPAGVSLPRLGGSGVREMVSTFFVLGEVS